MLHVDYDYVRAHLTDLRREVRGDRRAAHLARGRRWGRISSWAGDRARHNLDRVD
jgi:hypothetical protein